MAVTVPHLQKDSSRTFANRDWVETQPALDAGTNFTFVGAALDQGLGEHVTPVGLAGTQFSRMITAVIMAALD